MRRDDLRVGLSAVLRLPANVANVSAFYARIYSQSSIGI